jgi:hypothetical protein
MDSQAINNLVTEIAEMDRLRLVVYLREMKCSFPIDFTDEYLETVSLDRLRHIAVAVSLHRQQAA